MTEKFAKFIEVALGYGIDIPFVYGIPDDLSDHVEIGKRVLVPFRNKEVTGCIVGIKKETGIENIRPALAVLDPFPLLSPKILELCKWISEYYMCSWGQAIEAAFPAGVKLKGKTGNSGIMPDYSKDKPVDDLIVPGKNTFPLTEAQQNALNEIFESTNANRFQSYLLEGVTGSGKTEVYIRSIKKILEKGLDSILLVPEISLTSTLVSRFETHFGEKIGVFHSRLTQSKRRSEWLRIKNGDAKIVIGPRSAVFAPVKNPGMIIVDEEHDSSFKQDTAPCYNGRDVAVLRGKMENAEVILGSATPSIESYANTITGKYKLLNLPERVPGRKLPSVITIDMRTDRVKDDPAKIFSRHLLTGIQERISKNEQTILFLNRRGFAPMVLCRNCGANQICKHCDIAMVYHESADILRCHYCNSRKKVPSICPHCGSGEFGYYGIGTERIEEEARKFFPDARIARLDSDTARKRGYFDKIMKSLEEKNIDILVGTQLLAKGHDYPDITLIGIISADGMLNLPDFRAGERTFQLLTQVSGRAGRGESPGEVVIQTYNPDHYILKLAIKQDYKEFYKQEDRFRRALKLPPYSRIVQILVRGKNEKRTIKTAIGFASKLRESISGRNMELLGPAEAPISKIQSKYRWHILLKGDEIESLHGTIKKTYEEFLKDNKIGNIEILLDVDPQSQL